MSHPAQQDWLGNLEEFRARKDTFFRSGRGPVKDVGSFTGLSYFPPDPAWNLRLKVDRLPAAAVTLVTSTPGETQSFITWGTAELPGGERLILYARADEVAPAALFVPFRDATSGHTTYGAGRYLDVPLFGNTAELDFNRAYHPYCAYSDAWTCPLPPAENWLRSAVGAGEKLPELP
ncbi:DUF1684 domain-containing protein [Deinococcus rubellus]|uniref:DUF1684 domain-containing protein n=1 Tax=Deinococcus rubellus TaxID=1889240 RepID=A0ABY5YKA2_9DEIO|nr:DUF1684 domain-containing protein [Deinococcus rubellus]UWX65366.1 DUF1684 domain-containing protein [Deinococcus rubellus]